MRTFAPNEIEDFTEGGGRGWGVGGQMLVFFDTIGDGYQEPLLFTISTRTPAAPPFLLAIGP